MCWMSQDVEKLRCWISQVPLYIQNNGSYEGIETRAPTTLKSEGEETSLSGADKREVRDNREKW